jgi:hypothetical protein
MNAPPAERLAVRYRLNPATWPGSLYSSLPLGVHQMVTLPTIPAAFDCSRTCPRFERVDACRFSALFAAAGVRRVVNSHTVRVDVKFSNVDALAAAALALGGSVLGVGVHKLFATNTAAGFGVKLPNWRYPIVADELGAVSFDNYNGAWGDNADVDRLRSEYAIAAAKQAADALGWLSSRNVDGSLVVYHPNGGTLTVDATGGVDANGFNGVGCHEAAAAIGSAIGKPAEFIAKPEYYNAEQQLTVGG